MSRGADFEHGARRPLKTRLYADEVGMQMPARVKGHGQLPDSLKEHIDSTPGIGYARVQPISLSDLKLTATQATVGKGALKRHSKQTGQQGIGDTDAPLIVAHEGQHYVLDGHHRIAAALQQGQTAMPVRYHDTASADDALHARRFDAERKQVWEGTYGKMWAARRASGWRPGQPTTGDANDASERYTTQHRNVQRRAWWG